MGNVVPTPTDKVLFGVLLVVDVPMMMLGVHRLWKHRHDRGISFREPMLVVLSQVLLLIHFVLGMTEAVFGIYFNCLLSGFIHLILMEMVLMISLLRCFSMYFKMGATKEKLALQYRQLDAQAINTSNFNLWDKTSLEEDDDQTKQLLQRGNKGGWFMKHDYIVCPSAQLCALGGIVVLISIVFAAEATAPSVDTFVMPGDESGTCIRMHLHSPPYITWVMLSLVAVFIIKMRRIKTQFGLKNEIIMAAVVFALGFYYAYTTMTYLPWLETTYQIVSVPLLISVGTGNLLFLISVEMPMKLSYSAWRERRMQQSKVQSSRRQTDTGYIVPFDEFLADPDNVSAFTKFLSREYSVENVLFWQEINQFRRWASCVAAKRICAATAKMAQKKVRSRAIRLFEKYVKEGASLQVNLPSNVQRQLRVLFEELERDPDSDGKLVRIHENGQLELVAVENLFRDELGDSAIFDWAQTQIFELMQNDSYGRYLDSDLHQKRRRQQDKDAEWKNPL